MYKAFLFDFDGVLVDTTEIQVLSIAEAIKHIAGFPIKHPSDWEIIYSTITTKDKLIKFAKKRYFPMGQIEEIYSEKKRIANEMMLKLDPQHYFDKRQMFDFLKAENKKIAVVTNANGESTRMLLEHLDFMKYIDVLITNNDVTNSKPHPEPYIRAMIELGYPLEEYIIFEDSIVGIEAAKATGAAVCEVRHVNHVNFGLVAGILRETK